MKSTMLYKLIGGFFALLLLTGIAFAGFTIHASGLPDSIIPSHRQGLGCWEMLVRQSDPRGFYGDTPTALKQRAQFIDEYRAPLNSTHTKNFRILIPDEWKFDPQPVLVAGSHSVSYSIGPWAVWVRGDQFHFEVAAPKPDGTFGVVIRRDIPISKERWYVFKLTEHVSKTNNGYVDLTVDGVNISNPKDYYGPTVHPQDNGPPYTEFGPYVFGHWPVGVTYRRIFMILG